ncbi:ubiquitin-like protein Pup, partial [Bifidobacterium pullorum]
SQQPQEQAVAVDTSQTDGTVNALDAVLDDIESVLEQNAQEYVNSFVQKGGE